MLRNNRLTFLTAGFAGTLAIVGAGFSAWVFVGDITPIKHNVEASVNVTEFLEIGILQMVGETEARKEMNYRQYDYSIIHDNRYDEFVNKVNLYTYRKIVFSEGNPDSNALDGGMEFLRFYHDTSSQIYTFKREPELSGEFLIPDSYVNPNNPDYKNVKFHIGVRAANIDNNLYPDKTETIDDYIQLNPKYEPKHDLSNSFKMGDVYFSSFENPKNVDLYNFKQTSRTETVIKPDGSKVSCRVYTFDVHLQQMFWYEEGMKPYDRASVQKIQNAIENAKNNPDEDFEKTWSIQFQFASCLYQE